MNTITAQNVRNNLDEFSGEAAGVAHRALDTTRETADKALDSAHEGVSALREKIPSALGDKAAELERVARAGVERARAGYARAREQVDAASQRTVAYVREEPVRAVLIAAASGAVLAGALGWMARSRRS